jgi:hypothetical protein
MPLLLSGAIAPGNTVGLASCVCDTQNGFAGPNGGPCIDTQAPVFPHGCPRSWNLTASSAGAHIPFRVPAIQDNSPVASVNCSRAPGSLFLPGVTRVTCTARDTQHTVQCAFTVTINGEPSFLSLQLRAVRLAASPPHLLLVRACVRCRGKLLGLSRRRVRNAHFPACDAPRLLAFRRR